MNKPLELETGKQIVDAINRLTALGSLEKKDANAEAEQAGLVEFLKNKLFEHAGHLIGCWHAVKSEYEPLCNTMASILNRAAAIQAQRRAVEQASNPQAEPAADAAPSQKEEEAPRIMPANVLPLNPEQLRRRKR